MNKEVSMPRGGSTKLPEGVVPAAPMDIGEVANPPFAILPDPSQLFLKRSERLATLAPGHDLQGYLEFLAALTRAQHDVQAELAPVKLPSPDKLLTAREHAMPPISFMQVDLDEVADTAFVKMAGFLDAATLTDVSRKAVEKVGSVSPGERQTMMRAVLLDEVPEVAIAEHVLAAAALQVHFARLAVRLDVSTLAPIAPGACPACGSAPVSSMVVGWDGCVGTRFCTCSICQTNWHVVRVRCLTCDAEKGISYHSIDGGNPLIMGETCENCQSYVKILHHYKDAALDPVADDVASLALDLVLGREGWGRASANPFLLGY
ncbi:MAG: formate dehydrogenase accessory protein FdhE [Hyphomicrobiaceae bacterium]